MGGLLRTPKVQIASAAPVAQAASADSTDADTTDAARRRRGLAGTIATSDRGLTDGPGVVPTRKTLLGE
jgi:hypothetical protein